MLVVGQRGPDVAVVAVKTRRVSLHVHIFSDLRHVQVNVKRTAVRCFQFDVTVINGCAQVAFVGPALLGNLSPRLRCSCSCSCAPGLWVLYVVASQ